MAWVHVERQSTASGLGPCPGGRAGREHVRVGGGRERDVGRAWRGGAGGGGARAAPAPEPQVVVRVPLERADALRAEGLRLLLTAARARDAPAAPAGRGQRTAERSSGKARAGSLSDAAGGGGARQPSRRSAEERARVVYPNPNTKRWPGTSAARPFAEVAHTQPAVDWPTTCLSGVGRDGCSLAGSTRKVLFRRQQHTQESERRQKHAALLVGAGSKKPRVASGSVCTHRPVRVRSLSCAVVAAAAGSRSKPPRHRP